MAYTLLIPGDAVEPTLSTLTTISHGVSDVVVVRAVGDNSVTSEWKRGKKKATYVSADKFAPKAGVQYILYDDGTMGAKGLILNFQVNKPSLPLWAVTEEDELPEDTPGVKYVQLATVLKLLEPMAKKYKSETRGGEEESDEDSDEDEETLSEQMTTLTLEPELYEALTEIRKLLDAPENSFKSFVPMTKLQLMDAIANNQDVPKPIKNYKKVEKKIDRLFEKFGKSNASAIRVVIFKI